MIHWAVPHFPIINYHLYPFSTISVLNSFSLDISKCPVSLAVLCLAPHLLSLSASPSRSPIPGPWCCVDFLGGPSVWCQHLSKMLQLSCYIPVAALFIYVYSILDLLLCYKMFCLSFSLSLCPVSLSFLSFIRPTLSRKVPPCNPGPVQGFFLLEGSFSLPLCLPGGSGSRFRTL